MHRSFYFGRPRLCFALCAGSSTRRHCHHRLGARFQSGRRSRGRTNEPRAHVRREVFAGTGAIASLTGESSSCLLSTPLSMHYLNGMVRDFDETSMPDSMSHAIG